MFLVIFQRRAERESDDLFDFLRFFREGQRGIVMIFLIFLSCLKKGTVVFVLFLLVVYSCFLFYGVRVFRVCVYFFLLKGRSGDVRFRGFL